MKVTISYSVDLDEVLENLFRLYIREEARMSKRLEKPQKILKSKLEYKDEKVGEIAESIKECREAITAFDIKLAEINNILNGYYDIKYKPQEETSEQNEMNEEKQNNG